MSFLKLILFAFFAMSGCFATSNVCNNYLQIHKECIGEATINKGMPGIEGEPGPIGPEGPPGIVNYNVINKAIDIKFRDLEKRLNKKIATCCEASKTFKESTTHSDAFETFEEKILSRTITDCRKVAIEDAKSIKQGGGVFDIYINRVKTEVYCDLTTDNGGWMVFQRREDGSEDFYRGWDDYVNGFGNKQNEFWIGLEILHKITSSGKYEIRIDMEDWSGNKRYAKYSTFMVGDAASKYKLEIGGYSGDAGDAMDHSNNSKFTTKDNQNDNWGENCAILYKAGWWYNACHQANPNGFYFKGGYHASYADGINWEQWKGYHHSLKFFEMKI